MYSLSKKAKNSANVEKYHQHKNSSSITCKLIGIHLKVYVGKRMRSPYKLQNILLSHTLKRPAHSLCTKKLFIPWAFICYTLRKLNKPHRVYVTEAAPGGHMTSEYTLISTNYVTDVVHVITRRRYYDIYPPWQTCLGTWPLQENLSTERAKA